jgi:hypothetical protein
VALAGDLPNRRGADAGLAQQALAKAVDAFQSHLVAARRRREAEMAANLDRVLGRLGSFETRFRRQLELAFADVSSTSIPKSLTEQRRLKRRQDKSIQIDEMFNDWGRWFRETCEMADDPHPHVDVKAVFVG